MKEDPSLIDTLFKRVTEYTVTYIELIKLRMIKKITEVISSILPDIIISALLIVFLLFLNLGLAFWIGDLLGKVYLGFLLVAAFYFVLGCISHFFMRGWLRKIAANYVIRQIFKQNNA